MNQQIFKETIVSPELPLNARNSFSDPRKLVLKTAESIYLINVNEIVRCQARGNYTEFFISDGRKILVSKTLKGYEDILKNYGFFRLHHSHLINLSYIERVDKKEGGVIVMKDKSCLPLSLRKKEVLLKIFELI